jgi:hypothetical protein
MYLQPSSCTKEGQEEEEAAAALMDMTGLPQEEVFAPRSMAAGLLESPNPCPWIKLL